MTDPVRDQYEVYPYPARDPRDEAGRLIETTPGHLDEINHYVYAGRRDFGRPFRVLVAGGGTGDVTVMLAQQLADRFCRGEIVHLDLSAASAKVAEARLAARGLGNARFVVGSLTELAALGLGRFDYIDCVGVLHHLDDLLHRDEDLAETVLEPARLANDLAVLPQMTAVRDQDFGRTLDENVQLTEVFAIDMDGGVALAFGGEGNFRDTREALQLGLGHAELARRNDQRAFGRIALHLPAPLAVHERRVVGERRSAESFLHGGAGA